MILNVSKNTTRTLSGTVSGAGGSIAGWSLSLVSSAWTKSSSDPTQLAILDPVAGTFEVYLQAADTVPATLPFTLRAVAGSNIYDLVDGFLVFS